MKISSTKSIYGLEKVSCPKGTVPIRRVTKDDLIRGKYLFNDRTLTQNGFRTGTAHVFLRPSGGPYYGVNGTTSVWHPSVVMGQESAGHLYVQNGNGDGTNKIIVGWHVTQMDATIYCAAVSFRPPKNISLVHAYHVHQSIVAL
ncbi:hypothetical protein L195_g019351 [Trifolium pratense]|uniref:Neprosin domain-containing protein n=1 Tax=Trifolium pratense TaxID=57577 RepID=A0A2K3MZI2_TRIPR|nr:hypothetical protein L195_g019351 [Trifolium pratense]